MELEIINTKKGKRNSFFSEIRALSISHYNMFRFSKPAFKELELSNKENRKLDFIRDKKDPKKYYLKFSSKGQIDVKNRNPKEFSFSRIRLKKELFDAFKIDEGKILLLRINNAIDSDLGKIYPLEQIHKDNLIKLEEKIN